MHAQVTTRAQTPRRTALQIASQGSLLDKVFFARQLELFVVEASSERNNCTMSEGKKNTKKATTTSSPTKKSQYQLYQDLEKNVDVGKT